MKLRFEGKGRQRVQGDIHRAEGSWPSFKAKCGILTNTKSKKLVLNPPPIKVACNAVDHDLRNVI